MTSEHMATLEQIIEEARKLPLDEQRRLRAALDEIESNGNPHRDYRTRERERAWINTHREQYLGQWVAIEDDKLIAHGTNPRQVYLSAREAGISVPYIVHVIPKVDAYVGGW
jgi:hypothetical protein